MGCNIRACRSVQARGPDKMMGADSATLLSETVDFFALSAEPGYGELGHCAVRPADVDRSEQMMLIVSTRLRRPWGILTPCASVNYAERCKI